MKTNRKVVKIVYKLLIFIFLVSFQVRAVPGTDPSIVENENYLTRPPAGMVVARASELSFDNLVLADTPLLGSKPEASFMIHTELAASSVLSEFESIVDQFNQFPVLAMVWLFGPFLLVLIGSSLRKSVSGFNRIEKGSLSSNNEKQTYRDKQGV